MATLLYFALMLIHNWDLPEVRMTNKYWAHFALALDSPIFFDLKSKSLCDFIIATKFHHNFNASFATHGFNQQRVNHFCVLVVYNDLHWCYIMMYAMRHQPNLESDNNTILIKVCFFHGGHRLEHLWHPNQPATAVFIYQLVTAART